MTDEPPEAHNDPRTAPDDSPVVHRSAERARERRRLAAGDESPVRGGSAMLNREGGQIGLARRRTEAGEEKPVETGARRDSVGLGIRLEGEAEPGDRVTRSLLQGAREELRTSIASTRGLPPPGPPPKLPLPLTPPLFPQTSFATSTSHPVRPPRSSQRLSSQTTTTTRTTLSSSSSQSSPPMRRPTSSGASSQLSSSTAATSLPDLEEDLYPPSTSELLPPMILEEGGARCEGMGRQGSAGARSDMSWDESWEFPRPPVSDFAGLSLAESSHHGAESAASPSGQVGGWLDPAELYEDERDILDVLSSHHAPDWLVPATPLSSGLQTSASPTRARAVDDELGRSPPQPTTSPHPFSASHHEQHYETRPPRTFTAAPKVPAVVLATPPTSPPQPEWPCLRAGFAKSPRSRSAASFGQTSQPGSSRSSDTKRSSVLSTLAAPLAHLGRRRSTSSSGSGEGNGRRSRLSPLFEGGSSRSSLTRSASTRESVTALASPAAASPSASYISSAGAASPSGNRVRFLASPISASPSEKSRRPASPLHSSDSLLHPPPPKAAKMLGLAPSPASSIAERYRASERGSNLPPDLGVELSRSTAGKAAEVLGIGLSGAPEQGASGQGRRRVVLPDWPATRSEIQPCEIAVGGLANLLIEPSQLRASRPSFHSRTIVLTRLPGLDRSQPSSYTLHAFVSPRSVENEISRLEILPTSIVCAPASGESPSQAPAFLIKVTGRGCLMAGASRGITSAEVQDLSWILGTGELAEYKEWLSMLKEAVRETRTTPSTVQLAPTYSDSPSDSRLSPHPAVDHQALPPTSPADSGVHPPQQAGYLTTSTPFLDIENSEEDAAELVDFLLPLAPSATPTMTAAPISASTTTREAQRSSLQSSRSGSSYGSSRESNGSAHRHVPLPPRPPPPSAPLPPTPVPKDRVASPHSRKE